MTRASPRTPTGWRTARRWWPSWSGRSPRGRRRSGCGALSEAGVPAGEIRSVPDALEAAAAAGRPGHGGGGAPRRRADRAGGVADPDGGDAPRRPAAAARASTPPRCSRELGCSPERVRELVARGVAAVAVIGVVLAGGRARRMGRLQGVAGARGPAADRPAAGGDGGGVRSRGGGVQARHRAARSCRLAWSAGTSLPSRGIRWRASSSRWSGPGRRCSCALPTCRSWTWLLLEAVKEAACGGSGCARRRGLAQAGGWSRCSACTAPRRWRPCARLPADARLTDVVEGLEPVRVAVSAGAVRSVNTPEELAAAEAELAG